MTIKRLIKTTIIVVVICAGAVVGYLAGSQRAHEMSIRRLQLEASGNLGQRIEALSLLRLGDTPTAIERIESEVGQLGRSIALNRDSDRRILAVLKTYLSVVPQSGSGLHDLSSVLADVPVLEASQCDSALRQLLVVTEAQASKR